MNHLVDMKVDLPEELYWDFRKKVRKEKGRYGKAKDEIVKKLIEGWVREKERERGEDT